MTSSVLVIDGPRASDEDVTQGQADYTLTCEELDVTSYAPCSFTYLQCTSPTHGQDSPPRE